MAVDFDSWWIKRTVLPFVSILFWAAKATMVFILASGKHFSYEGKNSTGIFTFSSSVRSIHVSSLIVLDQITIIRKCKEGNHKAFEMLVDQHSDQAFRVAFRILNDTLEAEDVVQEAFIRAWETMEKFREDASFAAWIFKIATNLSYDILRSGRKKKTERIDEKGLEDIICSLENPEQKLDKRESALLIKAISEKLSPKQKLAFVLIDVEGLSHDEAVDITGISKTRLKSNLYHARKLIGDRMQILWK